MGLTSLSLKIFEPRYKELEKYVTQPEQIQRRVLNNIIKKAEFTEYGSKHLFDATNSYEDYISHVPVNTYEDLKGDIERMRHGEKDVLCYGQVRNYAKSSGTTNDKSKYIPVNGRALKHIHYQGGFDTVAIYLHNNPKSKLWNGRSLILGGSRDTNYDVDSAYVGDLSAILIENINPIANLFRVPKKSTALLSDFELKRERIARETMNKNVTNISGVPSWMMSVLDKVLELSGKDNISEVWPNLEVFFHGGVAFTPYRKQYEKIIPSEKMKYMETYNASEGFFGIQNEPADKDMLLMIDYDVFYEFIPMEDFHKEDAQPVPLWEVEKDVEYAMVITTSGGLWRYVIGDTVMFSSLRPYKFHITGRTKSFINAFGEELVVDNAEKALNATCEALNCEVREYTAAPIYMDDNARCAHQWVIEFIKEPEDINAFVDTLDKSLQQLNSDYEAKRKGDITLQKLKIVVGRHDIFNDWLKSKGKLGGQHKVPRLSNNRDIIDEILAMNK